MKITSHQTSFNFKSFYGYSDSHKIVDKFGQTPLSHLEWMDKKNTREMSARAVLRAETVYNKTRSYAQLGESLYADAIHVLDNEIGEQYSNGTLKYKLIQNPESNEASVFAFDSNRKPVSVTHFSKDGKNATLKSYINGIENVYHFKNNKMNSMAIGVVGEKCLLAAQCSQKGSGFGAKEIIEVYEKPYLNVLKESKYFNNEAHTHQFDSYYRFINGNIKFYSVYDNASKTYLKHIVE